MADEILITVKEVQEGGKYLANHYLSHGYILLDIQAGTRAQKFPEENRSGQQYYVRRNPVYVLGRPDGVKPAPPIPKRETSTKEEGDSQEA